VVCSDGDGDHLSNKRMYSTYRTIATHTNNCRNQCRVVYDVYCAVLGAGLHRSPARSAINCFIKYALFPILYEAGRQYCKNFKNSSDGADTGCRSASQSLACTCKISWLANEKAKSEAKKGTTTSKAAVANLSSLAS